MELLYAHSSQKYQSLDVSIPRKRDNKCVSVDTDMEELIAAAMRQNFVPVIDLSLIHI